MAITREDSESSLHSWTLLDNEEQSQAVAAVGSTSIDGSCKSSRSSSISGQWITAQELEETSGKQVDGSIQNSSVIVGDDIVDSDGDIVAIEEDTDDHLEEWIRAEAQQRRSLSHQDKVTADWSGLDSPEDDEYSLAESADSSQSESLFAHSLLRQSTGLADGEDGPEEEEALAEELPVDYPRGYTRSDKSYVHRRNEEINRGLTMYVVAMAVLVALLAVGHFGGTLIVTRHAHYGAPIDPRHNVLSAGKKHVFSHSALPRVQNDYTEIWNSLQQMLKSQAEMKRRIVVLEEENRQLRWRLADSRKRLTRIVHKEAAPSADNKNGSARLDEQQQPWWSGASEADSPWTLSDLLYLQQQQQQQQQQQPDRSDVKKPSTITLPSVKQTGLASILRNKSTTLSSSHSTKSNACVDQPSRQTTAPGSSVLHRLMKEKSAAASTLPQSLRRPAQRVTTTEPIEPIEPTEATGQDEDMAGWNSMKEQVQTMKADILRNFQQVKERYQQVNRSHHGWRNLSLQSTAPHVTPLPSQPAPATPLPAKSKEAKRQDSKYDYCGLGGTLYNDYCQLNLKADPYRHKAAQERPLSQGGPTGRHFWHTVQQLSRTKKMEKVLRKIWSLDVLGSPRLKDVMARVPHTFKTSRDWVSCQWRWWQKALDRTHPSSYGQCSPYLTAWWHNDISVQRDTQRRGRCPGKDGQCKVELQKGDKVKSKVQSLRQEEKKHKTRPAKIEQVVDHLLESHEANWYLQRAVDRATYRLKGLAQWSGSFNMSVWLFQRAQGRQAQRAQHQASHYNNGDTPVGQREEEALPADPLYAFLKHRATLRQQHRYP